MDSAIAARDRWLKVITADIFPPTETRRLSNNPSTDPEGVATRLPPYIDDIYISIMESDVEKNGPGDKLGVAGPLILLTNSAGVKLPIYARIRIDVADLEQMYKDKSVEGVIEHEMGHALGFGNLFEDVGLISAGDSKYKGLSAQQEWNKMGCTGNIPIETQGEVGTVGSHWDEECLGQELMTGSVKMGGEPFYRSRLTIGAMKDLGYTVNMDAADPFTLDQLSQTQCALYCPAAKGAFSVASSTASLRDGNATAAATADEERLGILSIAAAELQKNRENRPMSLPEGMIYVGGDFVTVLTRDSDGGIKGTTVTWEEVEEYLASGIVV
jgi:hypothetical protein